MSTEENKAIFRRYVEEVGNEGRLELADEIFDRDLAHQPDGSALERGPEDVKRFMGEFREVSPTSVPTSRTRSPRTTRWLPAGGCAEPTAASSATSRPPARARHNRDGHLPLLRGQGRGELGQLRPARHDATARRHPSARVRGLMPGFGHQAGGIRGSFRTLDESGHEEGAGPL